MTRLDKTVRRQLGAVPGWGELVVEIERAGVTMRRKGGRIRYGPIAWGRIYQLGAELKAAETRREKAAKRKARKRAR